MPPIPSVRAAPGLSASALMLIAMAAFSTMGAFIRLASFELHVLEIVFFRNALAVMLFAPLLLRRGAGLLRTARFKTHLLRNLAGACAMAAGFTAVTLIPLATTQALGFTTPLFTTALAVLILREEIRWRRIGALIVGFLGVMIVLDPIALLTHDAPPLGAVLALASAVLVSVSTLFVKSLSRTEAPEAIAFWMVLLQAPISLVAAVFVWRWPTAEALFILLCLAGAGTIGHLFWTRACALADLSELQPFEFLKLPLSALLGYLLFAEAPGGAVWIGGAVIFLATAYITHREARLGKPRRVAKRIVE